MKLLPAVMFAAAVAAVVAEGDDHEDHDEKGCDELSMIAKEFFETGIPEAHDHDDHDDHDEDDHGGHDHGPGDHGVDGLESVSCTATAVTFTLKGAAEQTRDLAGAQFGVPCNSTDPEPACYTMVCEGGKLHYLHEDVCCANATQTNPHHECDIKPADDHDDHGGNAATATAASVVLAAMASFLW